MIIEIDDALFYKLVDLMENRSKSIYNELKEIKPLDAVATNNTLQQARDIKTQRVKQLIRETLQELLSKDIQPTKYKVNKLTGIANVTISKYYDEILDEVKR